MNKPLLGLVIIIAVIFCAYLVIGEINQPLEGNGGEINTTNSFSAGTGDDAVEVTRQVDKEDKDISADKIIYIEESVICLKVENQMPVGTISRIPSDVNRILCWARLVNGKGEKIRYIWYFGGKITTSNWQVITGNRFRSWCPYSVTHGTNTAEGRVDIVNGAGEVLSRINFQVNGRKSTPSPRQKGSRLKRS